MHTRYLIDLQEGRGGVPSCGDRIRKSWGARGPDFVDLFFGVYPPQKMLESPQPPPKIVTFYAPMAVYSSVHGRLLSVMVCKCVAGA